MCNRYVKLYQYKYDEFRSTYQYYIDSYNALYQLKTANIEELNSIYKMIKAELIDSKKHLPKNVIRDILNIIPYNNGYAKSYLSLAKFISDDYHVNEVENVEPISNFLFYKEYGMKLDKSGNFQKFESENLDIHSKDTIYKALMNNDKEVFISFTEKRGFNKDQTLKSSLYPDSNLKYSLLELCCYRGAIDCFKFLRTKFDSKIILKCLEFSFLSGNPEIMSECLKYIKPHFSCMKYAIISHNIDFVTFLMNEYNLILLISECGYHNNLDVLLVYFDKTHDVS
ncbi:hypothetical protein TVAG_036960 [Trichomonas vaginalis G3]|uniref:DUF3447 domain-containing protein n=1 Tax=Trichomonas vaginalis (strain ATCC PRA-98 / G3) TaxID=412133 RepID=A2FH38_TRIV3|nr:protein of unknown function (DUF3447) [Trichomonas vaginalis G3]EAX95763.1 hypothetical protein TVAG_036960 [Trichomonas vaginalis G3]KAI5515018.1 protein of unknown function (DUF3447) [Trichomonas vaginalis G3]|eukprot:XP_001308693.1 hypothetical protein [Trichomonas vaginalis G3]